MTVQRVVDAESTTVSVERVDKRKQVFYLDESKLRFYKFVKYYKESTAVYMWINLNTTIDANPLYTDAMGSRDNAIRCILEHGGAVIECDTLDEAIAWRNKMKNK